MPCVAARPERGRRARRSPGIATATPSRPCPLAWLEHDGLAGDEVEAGVARVGPLRQRRVRPQRTTSSALTRCAPCPASPRSTRNGANRRRSRSRQVRPDETPSGESSRSIGEPSAYSWASSAPVRVRHEQLARSNRLGEALGHRSRSTSSLSPVRAETRTARAPGSPAAGGPLGRSDRSCSAPAAGARRRRSRPAPHRPPRPSGPSARRRPTRRRRAGRGRPRASPRASTRNPRPAGAAAADEADRVGHEVAPARRSRSPRGRVERLEQPVVHRGVGPGQRVEQRRLADVRVPGEGDRRRLRARPRLPARRALLAEVRAGGA